MNRRQFIRSCFGFAGAVAVAPVVAQAGVWEKFSKWFTGLFRKKRQIKAVWTPECAEDLRCWHNIDAEKELTAILSEEITKEIDEEIMAEIMRIAA